MRRYSFRAAGASAGLLVCALCVGCDSSDSPIARAVQGVACTEADETFHEHSHLSIFLNGEQLAVPSDIGVVEPNPTDTCAAIPRYTWVGD